MTRIRREYKWRQVRYDDDGLAPCRGIARAFWVGCAFWLVLALVWRFGVYLRG